MKETVTNCVARQVLPSTTIPVRVKRKILPPHECGGFFVHKRYINSRRPKAYGVYWGFVPGAGGDLWWVKHEDGTVAAYIAATELEDDKRK